MPKLEGVARLDEDPANADWIKLADSDTFREGSTVDLDDDELLEVVRAAQLDEAVAFQPGAPARRRAR